MTESFLSPHPGEEVEAGDGRRAGARADEADVPPADARSVGAS